MKLFLSVSLVLGLTAAAHADTKAADKAAPAAPTASDADAKKFIAFFDKIVDAVVADKDACPKMAADVNKLIDSNQDIIKMANEAEAAGKKLPKDAEDHMMASAKKMGPAMQKCGSDKDVNAAFMRLKSSKSSGGSAPAKTAK